MRMPGNVIMTVSSMIILVSGKALLTVFPSASIIWIRFKRVDDLSCRPLSQVEPSSPAKPDADLSAIVFIISDALILMWHTRLKEKEDF